MAGLQGGELQADRGDIGRDERENAEAVEPLQCPPQVGGRSAEADTGREFGRVPCAFAVGGVSAEQICAECPTRPDDGQPVQKSSLSVACEPGVWSAITVM